MNATDGHLDDPISQKDVEAVLTAIGRGGEWFPKDEVVQLIDRFRNALIDVALLNLIRQGRIEMRWDETVSDWRLRNASADSASAASGGQP